MLRRSRCVLFFLLKTKRVFFSIKAATRSSMAESSHENLFEKFQNFGQDKKNNHVWPSSCVTPVGAFTYQPKGVV